VATAGALTVLLGAVLLVVALRGGSYDVVPRLQASIVVWWLVALAVGFGLLPRRRLPATTRVAVIALLGLAAWITIGLSWTDSAERTIEEAVRPIAYAGLVLLVAWTFGPLERTIAVGVVTAIAGAVCLLALLTRLAPDVASSALAESEYARSRLDYPFNYWNALGCWAAMTAALGLAFSAHARTRPMRGVSLAVASFAPVVAYLTYSRTAVFSVGLAAVLVVAFSSRRWLAVANVVVAGVAATAVVLVIRGTPEIARGTGTAGRTTVAIALLAAALVAALAGALAPHARLGALRMPPRVFRHVAQVLAIGALAVAVLAGGGLASAAWRSFQGADKPLAGDPAQRLTTLGGNRHDLWPVALDVFADNPVHGTGAGTFEFFWNRDPRRSGHVIDAHSLYIESLAELGAAGLLLILVALGALAIGSVRAIRGQPDGAARGALVGCSAALLVFCVSAGVDWMWESTAIAAMALVLGTLAAARHGDRNGSAEITARPRWGVRVVGAAAAGLIVLVQVPVLVGASQVRSSQTAASDGRLVDALGDANGAADVAPWAATPRLQRALVLERVGQYSAAETAAGQATSREPHNWALWLVLARIRAERGRGTAALAAVARARALNPRAPLFKPGVARSLGQPGG
jgi:O-antigen ligase